MVREREHGDQSSQLLAARFRDSQGSAADRDKRRQVLLAKGAPARNQYFHAIAPAVVPAPQIGTQILLLAAKAACPRLNAAIKTRRTFAARELKSSRMTSVIAFWHPSSGRGLKL
jgi:hypothetical protein